MDADEQGIRSLFEGTSGVITAVSMPRDPKTGKNRGYAIVEMNSVLEAEQAVGDLNGADVGGRSMAVSLVTRPQTPRKWYMFGAR